ncbi:hypothetical protein M0R45_032122 [Rubus argutus]|uniref:Uncharacterized protein n=1 Tax=Rubus argutus TaxID=59490 RepID=A0AAW1WIK2_RUBAR
MAAQMSKKRKLVADGVFFAELNELLMRERSRTISRFELQIWHGEWSKRMRVIISGKLRAQRAKSMKFKDGYMISSGQPVIEYIDSALHLHFLDRMFMGLR